MKRLLAVLCFVLLYSCVWFPGQSTLRRQLNVNMEPGDSWKVRVKYWNERLENPYVKSDTPLVSRMTYRVIRPDEKNHTTKIRVGGKNIRLLLHLNGYYNTQRVDRLLHEEGGYWKVQEVLANTTSGRALFKKDWKPEKPIFLFHPDLSSVTSPKRLNFVRGGRTTGDWIYQSTKKRNGKFTITIKHGPSNSRVKFWWDEGQPWWHKARWFKKHRLIMQAETVR